MTNEQIQALKPGTYAVLYRDNWDGEGYVYNLIATLNDSGEWLAEESGATLLQYRGDEFIKVWPLDGDNYASLLAEREADKALIAEQAKSIAELERQLIAPLPIGELIQRLSDQTNEDWSAKYLSEPLTVEFPEAATEGGQGYRKKAIWVLREACAADGITLVVGGEYGNR